jgi:hypothetical protein
MPTTANKKHLPGITIDSAIPDFSKSPFIIKKVDKARALIAKYGLPKKGAGKKK